MSSCRGRGCRRLPAEGVGGYAVGRVDVEAVGIGTAFAGIHHDGGIGDVEHLQVLELIPQVLEVDGVELSGQGEVGDGVGFVFGHHGHQGAGFGNRISLPVFCCYRDSVR